MIGMTYIVSTAHQWFDPFRNEFAHDVNQVPNIGNLLVALVYLTSASQDPRST